MVKNCRGKSRVEQTSPTTVLQVVLLFHRARLSNSSRVSALRGCIDLLHYLALSPTAPILRPASPAWSKPAGRSPTFSITAHLAARMPRRISTRTVTSSATHQALPVPEQIETPYDSNIHHLRRHWKWAAFSQFFFTFGPLLAMSDVTLIVSSSLNNYSTLHFLLCLQDVENDLVHSTNRVLSRIMQRLLVTLTQDRKIS